MPGAAPDPPIALPSLPQIRDHELLRCIGRGSYGEASLARNVVGTFRAVKVVRHATFERADHFKREFNGIQEREQDIGGGAEMQ